MTLTDRVTAAVELEPGIALADVAAAVDKSATYHAIKMGRIGRGVTEDRVVRLWPAGAVPAGLPRNVPRRPPRLVPEARRPPKLRPVFVWTWPYPTVELEYDTPILEARRAVLAALGEGWCCAAALASGLELPAGQSAGRTLAGMLRSGLITVRRAGRRLEVRAMDPPARPAARSLNVYGRL